LFSPLLKAQSLKSVLNKNALTNTKNACQQADVRISLTSVPLNVEKKLPKLAGLCVLDYLELLLMSALALLTKVALKMPQRSMLSDSILWKLSTLSLKNDLTIIIHIIYDYSLTFRPFKDAYLLELKCTSLLRNKLNK
jgi:hypothetical protein